MAVIIFSNAAFLLFFFCSAFSLAFFELLFRTAFSDCFFELLFRICFFELFFRPCFFALATKNSNPQVNLRIPNKPYSNQSKPSNWISMKSKWDGWIPTPQMQQFKWYFTPSKLPIQGSDSFPKTEWWFADPNPQMSSQWRSRRDIINKLVQMRGKTLYLFTFLRSY